jgi:hypothetical protein
MTTFAAGAQIGALMRAVSAFAISNQKSIEASTMRVRASLLLVGWVSLPFPSGPALAWGPDGHHTVGAIADRLIGTNAAAQVKAILGSLSLQEALVWADCAKGIDPSKNFAYQTPGKYPECGIYETPTGEAEMADFVRRNNTNCAPKPGEEICHKQYHYSDVAIQHDHYDASDTGARTDDVVGAIVAATHVLQGDPAPAPFDFKDKREALLVLTHYLGDIHQPLHVGAVYLNAKGKRVNPDAGTFDPATETRGGNQINIKGKTKNLHATWDAVPTSLTASPSTARGSTRRKPCPSPRGLYWIGRPVGRPRRSWRPKMRSPGSHSESRSKAIGLRHFPRTTARRCLRSRRLS